MEIALKNISQSAKRVNPFLLAAQAIVRATIWVNNLFSMTKLERYEAGINTSGEGRDNS